MAKVPMAKLDERPSGALISFRVVALMFSRGTLRSLFSCSTFASTSSFSWVEFSSAGMFFTQKHGWIRLAGTIFSAIVAVVLAVIPAMPVLEAVVSVVVVVTPVSVVLSVMVTVLSESMVLVSDSVFVMVTVLSESMVLVSDSVLVVVTPVSRLVMRLVVPVSVLVAVMSMVVFEDVVLDPLLQLKAVSGDTEPSV